MASEAARIYSALSGACWFLTITPVTSSITRVFGQEIDVERFRPVICRRVALSARRFDGKPDGRFVLEISVSTFAVVSVWLQTVKPNKSGSIQTKNASASLCGSWWRSGSYSLRSYRCFSLNSSSRRNELRDRWMSGGKFVSFRHSKSIVSGDNDRRAPNP